MGRDVGGTYLLDFMGRDFEAGASTSSSQNRNLDTYSSNPPSSLVALLFILSIIMRS